MAKYEKPIGRGAMWEKTSQKDTTYFSGVMEFTPSAGGPPVKVSFVAFEVGDKRTKNSPDYTILVNSCGPAPARGAGKQREGQFSPDPNLTDMGGRAPEKDDDDIPF